MKFTKATLARLALPVGKAESIVFDDDLPGLGLRMRDSGSRRWIVQYGLGDKQRRMTIGNASVIDVAQARKTAADILAAVRLGRDPAGERDAGRAKASQTLGVIVPRFLARQEKRLRPASYRGSAYYLTVLWRPLHGLALDKIGRATIATRLNEIADEKGGTSADRARAAASAMFSWAMREGLADANPVIATNTFAGAVERDRFLSDDELRAVWARLGDDDFGRIVRLLILTGQRREEIAALRWEEIDRDRRLLTFEGDRTKNGQPHVVPLSDAALAILDAIPRPAVRELVFGEGEGGYQGFSRAKIALDQALAKAGSTLPDWRIHDLRRTFSTGAAEIGVAPHIVEAILNHTTGHKRGVAGVYNKAAYINEKRAALDLWAAHVAAVIEGRALNVVAFKPKSA